MVVDMQVQVMDFDIWCCYVWVFVVVLRFICQNCVLRWVVVVKILFSLVICVLFLCCCYIVFNSVSVVLMFCRQFLLLQLWIYEVQGLLFSWVVGCCSRLRLILVQFVMQGIRVISRFSVLFEWLIFSIQWVQLRVLGVLGWVVIFGLLIFYWVQQLMCSGSLLRMVFIEVVVVCIFGSVCSLFISSVQLWVK